MTASVRERSARGAEVPQVFEHLAELTAFRDRDLVDTTLVAAMRDLLGARLVCVHRSVGDDSDRRWLTRARLARGAVAASADAVDLELDQLPTLASQPARLLTLQQQVPITLAGLVAGAPCVTMYPLTTDREAVGVLELQTDQPLDAAAHHLVGSILRIHRNFQSLLDDSERDTLTGLLNRKTFDETFYKLVAENAMVEFRQSAEAAADAGAPPPAAAPADRRSPPSRLLHYVGVIDIDHFKQVNDRFGHLIGDEVLLLLARLMRSVFRYHDRLFRFGGEEFVVLLRSAGDAEAGIAFERLRQAVNAYAFPQVGAISVSAGYTCLKPGDTSSSAFERADRAVYWAKSHGRNRVFSHARLVASGAMADDSKVGDVELF
jgi:diguanylate cyclase (GGDEF)-like protein